VARAPGQHAGRLDAADPAAAYAVSPDHACHIETRATDPSSPKAAPMHDLHGPFVMGAEEEK